MRSQGSRGRGWSWTCAQCSTAQPTAPSPTATTRARWTCIDAPTPARPKCFVRTLFAVFAVCAVFCGRAELVAGNFTRAGQGEVVMTLLKESLTAALQPSARASAFPMPSSAHAHTSSPGSPARSPGHAHSLGFSREHSSLAAKPSPSSRAPIKTLSATTASSSLSAVVPVFGFAHSARRQRAASDLLFSCYVQASLASAHIADRRALFEDELRDLIDHNTLFSPAKAMSALLSFFVANGGLSFLLRIAHSRKLMKACFRLIAEQGARQPLW